MAMNEYAGLIKKDGSLYMWGLNPYGQLGNGTSVSSIEPVKIGIAKWKQISLGQGHSLGIQEDGSLWTWGSNASGQLGIGSNGSIKTSPTRIGTAKWEKVSAGADYSSGIQEDGSLWAWGDNSLGKLGLGHTSNYSSPQRVGDTKWLDISLGQGHSLGIQEDGSLWAWGNGQNGRLGLGITSNYSSPQQVGLAKWKKVSAGNTHSLGIQEDGSLWAWGANTSNQIGNGNDLTATNPTRIGTEKDWEVIVAGSERSLGIRKNGVLYTWGNINSGILGRELTNPTGKTPGIVLSDAKWSNASYGKEFALGIKNDGTAWTWGNPQSYGLGYSSPINIERPKAVISLDSDNANTFSTSEPLLFNAIPTVVLNTSNNRTLYENDVFAIEGQATDTDIGNIINAKYQINGGTIRAIDTKVSNGVDPLLFNKQLKFKGGKLFDGETEITPSLTDGTPHQLKVWSEDDQGGKSEVQTRTFYVVPNRVPNIAVDSIENKNGLINTDKMTISGTANDPDGNDIVVRYKINNGLATQIYSGPSSVWSFEFSLSDLVDGLNNIVVEVVDTYNFKTSKTIKLNKSSNQVELSKSVQRYKIVPPKGSAKGILLWVGRAETQTVSAEVSMVETGAAEAYVPMQLSNTAPLNTPFVEDEFIYEAETAKAEIHLKLNITGTGAVTLISGVLE